MPQVMAGLRAAKMHDLWLLRYEEIDTRDDLGYWMLLCKWWAHADWNGTDLMVVEHDIVIHPDVPKQFDECDSDVCVFEYWIGGSYMYGLGCTRFRADLIRRKPDAMNQAGKLDSLGLPPGHWKRLDGQIWRTIGPPCVHTPPVRHLHEYPQREPGTY